MRHFPQKDLLQALKASLRDLENLKLVSPDDLEILNLRCSIKERIAALERDQNEQPENASDGDAVAA
jgi:hypothetical protein